MKMLALGPDCIFWPPRQSSAVFGEHICVEVDSLFIVHLPSVVFMFENTAYPTGMQCTAVQCVELHLGVIGLQ